jgi:hypothetical protein
VKFPIANWTKVVLFKKIFSATYVRPPRRNHKSRLPFRASLSPHAKNSVYNFLDKRSSLRDI